MPVLHEKILWPLVGIIIFSILVAFYIDDRRGLIQNQTSTEQQAAHNSSAIKSTANKQHLSATSVLDRNKKLKAHVKQHKGFSGTIDDYLAESAKERSKELIAAANEHKGFSGSAEAYLNNKPSKSMTDKSSSTPFHSSTSMSMDEYLAQNNKKLSSSKLNTDASGAYHGDLDGYLTKFSGKNTSSKDPFDHGDHSGFHGSYEEYAKKYN